MVKIVDEHKGDSLSERLEKNVENREKMIDNLKREFIGMAPFHGDEIDCTGEINFESKEAAYKPYIQKNSKEEIIQRGTPLTRYGAAILFPIGQSQIDVQKDSEINIINLEDGQNDSLVDKKELEKLEKRQKDDNKDLQDEYDISSANSFKPNSMAVSFKARITNESKLIVRVRGGRYTTKKFNIRDKEREWWLRNPVEGEFVCSGAELLNKSGVNATLTTPIDGINLEVKIISRYQDDDTRLLTVSLVNRTERTKKGKLDSICLFQSEFIVTVEDSTNQPNILPYPEGNNFETMDDEEKSIALLYRNLKTYAIGHGCAADWGNAESEKVYYVKTEFLPTFETRSMTPDIKRKDDTPIEVSMKELAGLVSERNGFQDIEEIVRLYKEWIEVQKERASLLDPKFHKVAYQNLEECTKSVERMEQGLNYLKTDNNALTAFRLANHSILLQQITGEPRQGILRDDTLVFSKQYKEPDINDIPENKGKWRAFQIAFLLMSLHSAGEKDSIERDIVDLIFFPTGGGKTEAYLGLAAFSMFLRRIKNKNDIGVEVIMRYTLRLLTADQFQRTSRLICAMEYLRRENEILLGSHEFSIGIWLGSDTTPNSNTVAVDELKKIKNGSTENNPFILNTCPWCGAQLGEYKVQNTNTQNKRHKRGKGKNKVAFFGYKDAVDKVVTHCPDFQCIFFNSLPVYMVDEEIYKVTPTFIIGTVDKFAMLAWNSDIRSLFGLNNHGERVVSPPGLIIQDELHLISGPLGSLTGFFETIIDEFCTDRRSSKIFRAKIVCSTATIRRYKEQVEALYARKDVRLFPAPGLDEDDSFFATYAKDNDGNYTPGRKYLGINAPILGSMQTLQVRSLTSLLQTPTELPVEERDPWWTLLIFFNSLRELGTTITLMHSDIPNHIKVLRKRFGLNYDQVRKLKKLEELTSRLSNDEISVAIDKLKQKYDDSGKVIDISLASNIIEVGVDIDRLSLMSVVGQPKTTAQYIQVTGRVGRRWYERPGLIVTLYSATKPRDRSHFEKFRSYHQMLYAQVEPTSVTPFSPRVIDRALHAVMVAYVRQFGDQHEIVAPRPFPQELINEIETIILDRVSKIDNAESENVKKVFNKRKKEWEGFEPLRWSGNPDGDDYPLLRVAGQYADKKATLLSWPTMMSMRNVDAQCQGKITDLYLDVEED